MHKYLYLILTISLSFNQAFANENNKGSLKGEIYSTLRPFSQGDCLVLSESVATMKPQLPIGSEYKSSGVLSAGSRICILSVDEKIDLNSDNYESTTTYTVRVEEQAQPTIDLSETGSKIVIIIFEGEISAITAD